MPGEAAEDYEFRSLSVFSTSQPNADFRCEVMRDRPWHAFQLLRAEAWAAHTLRHDEKKCGIRSVITKTETRGPYTRPFTVYFVHTKTAFSVKGVCKRFSDFKELDAKIKKQFKGFKGVFPPDKVFNSMQPDFVSDRRKQLQKYLDDALAVPVIAAFADLHEFLGIPEYMQDLSREQADEAQREQKRLSAPDSGKPETYLRAIEDAKLKSDRVAEAQGFNALGLVYCEQGLDSQGIECLESALELCRVEDDIEGVATSLSNLGCAHNMMECQQVALEYLDECHDVLADQPAKQAEVKIKLALTCAANGDSYEAVEHCLACLEVVSSGAKRCRRCKRNCVDAQATESFFSNAHTHCEQVCRNLEDQILEAACLFALGGIYYDAGEVRQAVEAFERCLVLRRKTRDKIGLAETLNKLGLTYCDIGYDLRAIDYFEQSLVICEDNADLHGQAVCLQHLGNVFKMQKDTRLAVDFFERCLAVRNKIGDLRGAADCHDSLGLVYYGLGRFAEATAQYELSLAIRTKLGDRWAQSDCHKSLGTAYIRMQDTEKAVNAFRLSLEIHQELGNDAGIVDALISLGLAHFKAGDNEESVRQLEDALDKLERSNSGGGDDAAGSGRAVCLDHLGNVYSKMGRPQKAVLYYQQSLRVKQALEDVTGEARCRVRIGIENLSLDDIPRAHEEFSEALKLFERLEDDNGMSVCYENLGDMYMKLGEISDAIRCYELCLPIKADAWDKVGQAQCLDNLGLAHYSSGDLLSACECYEQSLALWKEESDKPSLMACCEALGGVCFQLDEHLRSIECYVQYLALSHEIGDGAADHQILLRLGVSNAAIGEDAVALEFLKQALASFADLGDLASRTVCLQHIGRLEGKMGRPEEGLLALQQALRLRKEVNDQQGAADCQQEVGLLYLREGRSLEAREALEEVKRQLTDFGNQLGTATVTMHIGSTLAAEGRHKEAAQTFKAALAVGEASSKEWDQKPECLTCLGSALLELKDAAAVPTLEQALVVWQERGNRAGEAALLMRLAEANLSLQSRELAFRQVEQSLELRKVISDRRGQADSLFLLGELHLARGQTQLARDAYQEALELRSVLQDGFGRAECLCALGKLDSEEGQFEAATAQHREALKIRRELDDLVGVAVSLDALAACCSKFGDVSGALAAYEECLAMMRSGKDGARESKCLLNIGACHADQGDLNKAVEIFEQALVVARSCRDMADEAACFCNIGSACVHLGQLERSLECFDIGLRLLRQVGDRKGEAECLHNLGVAHFNDGRVEQATNVLNEALQISRELQDSRGATQCLQSLKTAYVALGNAEEAAKCVQLIAEYTPDAQIESVAEQLQVDLELAENTGDRESQAVFRVRLGDACAKIPATALQHYEAAAKLLEEIGDKQGLSECHHKIGKIKLSEADHARALEAFEVAMTRYDSHWRDGTVTRVAGYADLLFDAAHCHLAMDRADRAADLLEDCLKLREEAEDEEGIEEVQSKLGVAYARLGDTRKAMAALSRGVMGDVLEDAEDSGRVLGVTSLASTLMSVKRFEDAQRTIEKHQTAIKVYQARGDRRAEANCLVMLGQVFQETQQLQQAIESYSEAQALREDLGDDIGVADVAKRRGCALAAAGNMTQAVEVLEDYLEMVSGDADMHVGNSRSDEVDACCVLARAAQVMGEVASASESLKRALALSHEAGDRQGEAKSLIAFGELYRDLWVTKRAAEHLERALSICIELQDKPGEAKCLTLLGQLHFARGDTTAATRCLEEALALGKQSIFASSEGECLVNIGNLRLQQGELPQAKLHFERAHKLCSEQSDRARTVRALCGLSQCNLALGESYTAADQLMSAIGTRKELGDLAGEAECLRMLANAYIYVGKLPAARKVTEQARRLSASNGAVLEEAMADLLLARICSSAGEQEEAVEVLQRALELLARTELLAGSKVFLDPRLLGECLKALGRELVASGQVQRGVEHLEQAEQVLSAAEDMHSLAHLRGHLAMAFLPPPSAARQTQNGVLDEGLAKLAEALEAHERHRNKRGIAEVVMRQGVLHCHKGDQLKGFQKLRLALDMFKELQDKRGIAETTLEMGHASNDSPQGVIYYEQSLVTRRQASDLSGEALCLRSLASLHAFLGNTRAACKCWHDALNLHRELGDAGAARSALEHLCALYSQLEDYARVVDFVGQLRDSAMQRGDPDAETHALVLMGKCNLALNNLSGAEGSFKAALKICGEHPKSEELMVRAAECHDKLAHLYLDEGRPEGRVHLDEVQKLKTKLGKDILKGVVEDVRLNATHIKRQLLS